MTTRVVWFQLGVNAVSGRAPHLIRHVEMASGVVDAALDVQACFPIFVGVEV